MLRGETSFAEMVKESFREGLTALIGKSGMEAVYINFKLQDNLMNPKATHQALVPAFKERGAEILERAVAKELFRRIDERYEPGDNFSYEHQFNRARELFVARQIKE